MLTTEQREALKTAIAYLDAGGNPRTAESLRLILASAAPTEGREAEENVSLIAKMSAKLYTCHVANVSVAIDDFRDLLAYVHDLRCRIATAPTMSEAATHGLRVACAEIDLIVSDPMGADHVEISKRALRRWREALDTAIDRAAAKGGSDA